MDLAKFVPSQDALKRRIVAFAWNVGWFVASALSAVLLDALTAGEIKLPASVVVIIAAGLTQVSKHANNVLQGKQ